MPDSPAGGASVGAPAQGGHDRGAHDPGAHDPGAHDHGARGIASDQGAAANWATEVTDRVIEGVDKLKSRTTRPVVTALRAVVYGIVVLVALAGAGIFAVIGVVRIWDAYFPVSPLGLRVWLGYVIIGALLFLAGGLLLARRRAPGKG